MPEKVSVVKLCVWGGGVVYVSCSCYHGCGIFSIGMLHPIHVQTTISRL